VRRVGEGLIVIGRKEITLKHVAFVPSLDKWTLEATERYGDKNKSVVHKAASEALHYAFQSEETYIYFPAQWGDSDGIDVDSNPDPLNVYLCVDIGWGHPSVYSTNLREALASTLKDCASDGSFSDGLSRISAALKSLSSEIDMAIKAGTVTNETS
jgi:hypothetical protein